ncbi:hypothetical protein AB4Z09_24845 [Rhodococcus sp. TAF43]|uniref:hypothetical protein n=1 Tax=unclassified Rhodococcus (in: high G+C Gram-positive bacteria) TaxID=192944 RepID=UPI003D1D69A2
MLSHGLSVLNRHAALAQTLRQLACARLDGGFDHDQLDGSDDLGRIETPDFDGDVC